MVTNTKYANEDTIRALVGKMGEFATKDAVQAVSDKLKEFVAMVRHQLVKTEDTSINDGQYLAPVITNKGTLVTGCSDANSNKPLVYSEDNGVTWKDSNITPQATLGLGVAKDGAVIAVVHNGIYYSVDGGKAWQAASFTVPNGTLMASYGTVKVFTAPNGNIIVHADRSANGAVNTWTSVSTNNGRSWSTIQNGTLGCRLMSVVPCKNGHLLALTTVATPSYPALGYSGENASNAALNAVNNDTAEYYALYASPHYGILKNGVHSYALARGDQSRLPLDSSMLRSTDGGVTWQEYATVRGRALYLFTDDNGDICALRGFVCQGKYNNYSNAVYGAWAYVVSKSFDNGASWSDSATCYTKIFAITNNSGSFTVPWFNANTMASVAANIMVTYSGNLAAVVRTSDLATAPFKMAAGTQIGSNAITAKQVALKSPDGTYIMGPFYSIDGFHWRVVSIGSVMSNSSPSTPDRQFNWQDATLLPDGSLVCVGDTQYGIKRIPSIEPFI